MSESISVVVLVRNHRRHVRPCLETVRWADEVVVIDDDSTDGSNELALGFPNVRVIRRSMLEDWSAQMNFGLSSATSEWIFQLDVDERVPEDLADELQTLAQRTDLNGVALRILGSFMGSLMGNQAHSAYATRMVRRGCGKFERRRVHARLVVDGAVERASALLVHLGPFPTAESFWTKNALYARLEAASNVERGVRPVGKRVPSAVVPLLLKPLGVFLQRYLLQGMWRMGVVGLNYAIMRAVGYYMVCAATWERLHQSGDAVEEYCRARGIPYLDESEELP